MAKINLRVDPEKMGSMITVDDYLGMQEGDIAASVNVLSKFIVGDDDEFLSYEEGRKLIGLIPMDELPGVMEEFSKAIQDAANPPG